MDEAAEAGVGNPVPDCDEYCDAVAEPADEGADPASPLGSTIGRKSG